jgi:hypothetical protein
MHPAFIVFGGAIDKHNIQSAVIPGFGGIPVAVNAFAVVPELEKCGLVEQALQIEIRVLTDQIEHALILLLFSSSLSREIKNYEALVMFQLIESQESETLSVHGKEMM